MAPSAHLTVTVLIGAVFVVLLGFATLPFIGALAVMAGIGFGNGGQPDEHERPRRRDLPATDALDRVGWALGIGRLGNILGPTVGGIMLSFGWAPHCDHPGGGGAGARRDRRADVVARRAVRRSGAGLKLMGNARRRRRSAQRLTTRGRCRQPSAGRWRARQPEAADWRSRGTARFGHRASSRSSGCG